MTISFTNYSVCVLCSLVNDCCTVLVYQSQCACALLSSKWPLVCFSLPVLSSKWLLRCFAGISRRKDRNGAHQGRVGVASPVLYRPAGSGHHPCRPPRLHCIITIAPHVHHFSKDIAPHPRSLVPLERICSATQCTAQQLRAQLSSAQQLSEHNSATQRLVLTVSVSWRVCSWGWWTEQEPEGSRVRCRLLQETETVCRGQKRRALQCERDCSRETRWKEAKVCYHSFKDLCLTRRDNLTGRFPWEDVEREKPRDGWFQKGEVVERWLKKKRCPKQVVLRGAGNSVLVSVKPWRGETKGWEVGKCKRRWVQIRECAKCLGPCSCLDSSALVSEECKLKLLVASRWLCW